VPRRDIKEASAYTVLVIYNSNVGRLQFSQFTVLYYPVTTLRIFYFILVIISQHISGLVLSEYRIALGYVYHYSSVSHNSVLPSPMRTKLGKCRPKAGRYRESSGGAGVLSCWSRFVVSTATIAFDVQSTHSSIKNRHPIRHF